MNVSEAAEAIHLSRTVLKSIRSAASHERQRAMRDLDPYDYVACWTEAESIDGRDCDALVFILATKGCSWALRSGCSMCGYTNDSSSRATDESIWSQYQKATKNLKDHRVVKIYTSGSFLDTFEISHPLRTRILSDLYPRVDEVVVETRHEYITEKNLGDVLQFRQKLMLAVGLESSNDMILNYSVNKPSNYAHYLRATKTAAEMGFRVKSYLMLKPPFVSELDSIEDAVKTTEEITSYTDTVSINPTNIQKDTIVELMWRKGNYRPPWLWSVVEVLRRTHHLDRRVLSKPTGAGTVRGAHNCGKCDDRVMEAIADYSVHRDISSLEKVQCECKSVWRSELAISELSQPSYPTDYRMKIAKGNGSIAGI